MFYVYLLENIVTKGWYIGFTEDVYKRLENHNFGRGSKTTKAGKSWDLIYFEAYINKFDALGREKFLKSGSGHRFLRKQLATYFKSCL